MAWLPLRGSCRAQARLRGQWECRWRKEWVGCVLSFSVCTEFESGDPFPQCAHWGLPLRGAAPCGAGDGVEIDAAAQLTTVIARPCRRMVVAIRVPLGICIVLVRSKRERIPTSGFALLGMTEVGVGG